MSPGSILVLGLGIVLLLPLFVRIVRQKFDPFEPIILFAIAWGVMFVARPASMLVHGRLSYLGVDIRATFPPAMLLALVGGVAFVIGYEFRAGRALARALPTPAALPTRTGVLGAASLVGLALIAVAVLVWPAGGLRRLTILFHGQTWEMGQLVSARGAYPILTAMLTIPAAVLLLGLATRERRAGLLAGAALAYGIALAVTVPIGARTFVLPLLGGGVTLIYVMHRTRPRLATVVILLLLAFIASYALITFREPGRRAHLMNYVRQFEERPFVALSPVVDGADAEMAPVLAGALTVIPSRLHYRYGAALGSLVIRPIPRQLWPGKPQTSERQVVKVRWPKLWKDGYNPAFSPLLVFYWDFGLPGVLIGMAAFGVSCRLLYEWFLRHDDNLAAQIIFSIGIWLIPGAARNDPVTSVVLGIFLVVPIFALERFAALRTAPARQFRGRLSQK